MKGENKSVPIFRIKKRARMVAQLYFSINKRKGERRKKRVWV
jgi:hypothetical protein